MGNCIETDARITHVSEYPTSMFFMVKEEGQYGSYLKVKAFCPKDLKATPEVWKSHFANHQVGARVRVVGSLRFERETTENADRTGYEPVKHPISGRDIYEPFIWATQIDVLFDPAMHQLRSAPSHAPRTPAREPVAAAPTAPPVDDRLPPLTDEAPTSSRARVAWNQ